MTAIQSLITSYQSIATSTIGHVLDIGYVPDVHIINSVRHVTGRVRIATLHSINAMALRNALLDSQQNDVLIIDARQIGHRACWGEQRHRGAIYHQLNAVVVLGSVTDLEMLRCMRVPIFARTVSCLTTRQNGVSHVDFATPIQFAETRIENGDLMIGDADGVFVLKPEIAQQYLPQFQEMERLELEKRNEFFKLHKPQDYYQSSLASAQNISE